MVHDFLSSEGLEERLVDGCMEKDLPYRRITGKDKNAYVWMEAKKYIDANENTAIITLHNEKIVQNTVIKMERELIKKEQDMAKQYWDMVSLLTTVLNHNQLVESGYPDGLKGNAIPMCAQVVGIVDAYDALINDRPYKRKYEPEEAIRMISNGECEAFSTKMIQCLMAAVIQPEWLKVTKS